MCLHLSLSVVLAPPQTLKAIEPVPVPEPEPGLRERIPTSTAAPSVAPGPCTLRVKPGSGYLLSVLLYIWVCRPGCPH